MALIYTARGTPIHDELVDACLRGDGIAHVDGEWFEVLTVRSVEESDSFAWTVRRVIAGAA